MSSESQKNIELSFSEFQFLLNEHGLKIATDSPLEPLLSVDPEGDIQKLTQKGLLEKEGEWHDVLIAITNPDFITSSILAFTGMAASSSYFTNRSNSKLIVGCWPTDEKKLRISFPWEPVSIIANSLTALVVDDCGLSETLNDMAFTPDGFAAFSTAVDATRTAYLASTLQRQQIGSFLFPRTLLDDMIEKSINDKSVDSRWLTTLFFTLIPDIMQVSKMKITDKGFKELLDLQLITAEKDDKWGPTSKLKEIAFNWLIPLPAVFHEAVTIKADRSQERVSSIALRGSGPLCQIKWEKSTNNNKEEVSMRFIKKDDYWLQLMGIMTPPGAEEISTTDTELEKPEVEQEAKPFEESSAEPIYKCPYCDAKATKGQKFCTECGHELPEDLEAINVVPSKKRCPRCGAELKPGAKFCTECGAKV